MTEKKRETCPRDIPQEDVTLALSRMSQNERAKLSAMIETDGDVSLRQHLLGAVGQADPEHRSFRRERDVPAQWSIIYVLDRLEEAVEVRAMMPASTKPKAFGTAWPSIVQERIPLVVQAEMAASGELEVQREDKNRVRLPPSSAQVSRAEQAERWPFEFLADQPDLARAIGLRSLWSVMKVDIRRRCRARGIDHAEFNLQWQAALAVITGALIARKVPVS